MENKKAGGLGSATWDSGITPAGQASSNGSVFDASAAKGDGRRGSGPQ